MTLYMTSLPSLLGRFLIVLARVGLVIRAQNMVQCAAFDLDATTIKAAIRVWKGVVEYSPRPWMPASDVVFSNSRKRRVRERRLALPLPLVTGAPAGASLD